MPHYVKVKLKYIVLSALSVVTISLSPAASRASTSYYNAFGRKQGLNTVVGDFLNNVLADSRIKAYFTNANIPALHAALVTQFCMLEGGPCEFNENMKTVHQNLGVTDAAFNALAEDLQKSMVYHNIPLAAQNNLLAKLAPMEKGIVTK
ncbi:group 1 truncated hemoglobin [Acidocella sp.]|uniref:group I truncated hemoglobin n=1 Tax=Acidocella sp. TaxID=50710 RepID=UPI00185061F4|nr:group 1 truncated hemoglobin [Acidocella sp.]NNM57105.1 group 1 truncated hemoglobin [Acidocella sp.]